MDLLETVEMAPFSIDVVLVNLGMWSEASADSLTPYLICKDEEFFFVSKLDNSLYVFPGEHLGEKKR